MEIITVQHSLQNSYLKHSVWKSQKKSHSTFTFDTRHINFRIGQKLVENAKIEKWDIVDDF